MDYNKIFCFSLSLKFFFLFKSFGFKYYYDMENYSCDDRLLYRALLLFNYSVGNFLMQF